MPSRCKNRLPEIRMDSSGPPQIRSKKMAVTAYAEALCESSTRPSPRIMKVGPEQDRGRGPVFPRIHSKPEAGAMGLRRGPTAHSPLGQALAGQCMSGQDVKAVQENSGPGLRPGRLLSNYDCPCSRFETSVLSPASSRAVSRIFRKSFGARRAPPSRNCPKASS